MRIPRFIRNVLIGIPLGIAFTDTVGYVARVEGISMQPALNPEQGNSDYVFLNRWLIRRHDIQRGDIVSVSSPKTPSQTLIKRVVGLAGDIVGTHGYKLSVLEVRTCNCHICAQRWKSFVHRLILCFLFQFPVYDVKYK